MQRFIAVLLLFTIPVLSSGCATFPTGPGVHPIDAQATEQAVRDVLLQYIIAAHPELSDEEALAEVDRIMADETSELQQEIRRAMAIRNGLSVLYLVFSQYFDIGADTVNAETVDNHADEETGN